jgi:AraC-like DNA-binding protein
VGLPLLFSYSPGHPCGLPPGGDGRPTLVRPLRPLIEAHRHDELELNLVTAGRAWYLGDGDRRIELGPGALTWWFPSEDHLLIAADADTSMWVVKWRPALIGALIGEQADPRLAGPRHPGPRVAVIGRAAMQQLGGIFAALSGYESDPVIANHGYRFALRHAWAVTCAQAAGDGGADLHPAVARALRRLGDDPAVLVADLAADSGISPDRLGRLVRAQLGHSLVELRTRRRVEVALARADAGGTLLAGALEAGFSSYPAFIRACRRIHGASPQAVRQGDSTDKAE